MTPPEKPAVVLICTVPGCGRKLLLMSRSHVFGTGLAWYVIHSGYGPGPDHEPRADPQALRQLAADGAAVQRAEARRVRKPEKKDYALQRAIQFDRLAAVADRFTAESDVQA